MTGVAVVLVSLVVGATALYGPGDNVVELTPSNFHSKVINSDELWLVEFFAPWCGHCQSLVPDYKKAAKALKGIVKVGSINGDEHKGLAGQYEVKGFPTIKFFGEDKFKPIDYQNERRANNIVDFVLSHVKRTVNDRMIGKSKSGGDKKTKPKPKPKTEKKDQKKEKKERKSGGDTKAVVELTDSNFDKEVLGYDGMVLVEFYAPWCGHCKNLAPHWAQAAAELKGHPIKLCAIDATVNSVTSNRYNINGFPTIKMFPAGRKDGTVENYDGGRTASEIVNWVIEKVAANVPPPDVYEITSNNVLQDNCESHQLCIVSVLPQIYDCQSKCRNNYLKVLRTLGEKFKKNQWGWIWAEAGAQQELEDALEMGGFGYPALAAVNTRKMKYSLLKGQFSEKGIHEFLRDLSYGKGSTAPLRKAGLPKIKTRDPWDGKDAELPVEEDIDLSDVELDDLDDVPKKKTEL